MSYLSQKATMLSVCFLVVQSLMASSAALCETIVPIDRLTYTVDSVAHFTVPTPITALLLGGDTVLSGSCAGIWAQYSREQLWHRLIGSKKHTDWRSDCDGRDEFNALYFPMQLWRLPITDEIIVFEGYCSYLLKLQLETEGESKATLWRKDRDGDYLERVTIQGNVVLSGVLGEGGIGVALSRVDDPDYYRQIVELPRSLADMLDSVGISYPPYIPALNPRDSTIWLLLWGYDYIHIVDFEGHLLDSVHIGHDFIRPKPPASRIRSQAVWKHWDSQWTPPKVFQYVPPGYFILQYRTEWDRYETDSIPRYSTQVWNDRRERVSMEVRQDWQLAGVQSDGRLIFGRYLIEDHTWSIELNIVRIEP